MSRSINTEKEPNPAKRWFQWDSDSKGFKYYDKEAPHPTDASKKGANIPVPLPFKFLVLDRLHTIAGFSDADKSSIYSNEVRDLKTQVLNVKIKKETVTSGLYEQIKGKPSGARYCQSVYIAYFDEKNELQLGNIKMVGSSLGSWIEFCKGKKITEGGIKVVSTKFVEKNKKINWNEPVFEAIKVKPETDAIAIALDTKLQSYLSEYFNNAKLETTEVTNDVVSDENKVEETVAPVIASDGVFDEEDF